MTATLATPSPATNARRRSRNVRGAPNASQRTTAVTDAIVVAQTTVMLWLPVKMIVEMTQWRDHGNRHELGPRSAPVEVRNVVGARDDHQCRYMRQQPPQAELSAKPKGATVGAADGECCHAEEGKDRLPSQEIREPSCDRVERAPVEGEPWIEAAEALRVQEVAGVIGLSEARALCPAQPQMVGEVEGKPRTGEQQRSRDNQNNDRDDEKIEARAPAVVPVRRVNPRALRPVPTPPPSTTSNSRGGISISRWVRLGGPRLVRLVACLVKSRWYHVRIPSSSRQPKTADCGD